MPKNPEKKTVPKVDGCELPVAFRITAIIEVRRAMIPYISQAFRKLTRFCKQKVLTFNK